MKTVIIVLVIFSFGRVNLTLGQQSIQYGSNDGKYVSIYNTKVYYEEYGKGTPLLMIHGGTASINSFRKVIPDLSKRFRVIAVDSPGHGRSQQSDTLSCQIITDYFSKLIDILKLDSVYVIGLSDGGIVAQLLAADRPDKIKRAIASGAQFDYSGYNKSTKQFVDNFSPEVVEKDWGSWVKDYQSAAYDGNDWRDFILDVKKMWSEKVMVPIEKVKKIRSRFLIVLGDRDMITIEHGIEMYNSITGSEFLVLPNTSHDVFNEQPELVNKIAIEFLTKK